MRRILFKVRFLGLITIAAVAGMWPMTAQAAPTAPPGLGAAAGFAVLSANPLGGAVTCNNGSITGNVGSTGAQASVVHNSCPITGTITAPVSTQVVSNFNTAYGGYPALGCGTMLTGTLAGRTLGPGVYCFDAAAALTGLLTLSGPSNGTWIFKIGSGPTGGALTGTGFSVVMAGAATPCSVNWWSAAATTFTDSFVIGTILSGAAITLTRGTLHGNALAKAGVTITGTTVTGCTAGGGGPGQGCEQDEDTDEDGAHHGDGDEHHAVRHANDSEGSRHGDDSEGCDSEDSHQSGDSEDSHQGGEDHKVSDAAKVETHDRKTETKSKSDSKKKSESQSD